MYDSICASHHWTVTATAVQRDYMQQGSIRGERKHDCPQPREALTDRMFSSLRELEWRCRT